MNVGCIDEGYISLHVDGSGALNAWDLGSLTPTFVFVVWQLEAAIVCEG